MPAPRWLKEADRVFFGSKKPWSIQKDLILANYIPPYLNKILTRRQTRNIDKPVLFADLFAGKGIFDDGSEGSPILIVKAAEATAPGKWSAVFGNLNEELHTELSARLRNFPDAHVRNVRSLRLLELLQKFVEQRSLFVFIDPYSITGYDFELLAPLLRRVKQGLSTEVLINFMVADFHKKSARDSVRARGLTGLDPNTRSKLASLDKTLGGDWWREFQYEDHLSTEARSKLVVDGYINKLKSEGLNFVGQCPVREKDEASPNYRLIHGSANIEALKLMNETMGNAIGNELHRRSVQEKTPLFHGQIGDADFQAWERGRHYVTAALVDFVPRYISKSPGLSRVETWGNIVQDHFLQFFHKEYRATVKNLHDSGIIIVRTPDGHVVEPGKSKGLNDKVLLFLGGS
ncbi:MAG: three-Cys-motif partner protein TcmP [Bacteroidetes bacterium]|nr:three-Cys-motif partner protein TcmP [Bacteroidota bacterium]